MSTQKMAHICDGLPMVDQRPDSVMSSPSPNHFRDSVTHFKSLFIKENKTHTSGKLSRHIGLYYTALCSFCILYNRGPTDTHRMNLLKPGHDWVDRKALSN